MKLSSEQELAVEICTDDKNRMACVTGGAGVGKTIVLGHVYREYQQRHVPTVLVAPTGRAAKRIQELTGIPAMTIHRLLEFPMPDEQGDPGTPRRGSHNPIDRHVVIVDEASMLGTTLYSQLLSAMRNGGLIRFFGDNNQLPPVESGQAPFEVLLTSQPSIELTFNYRSDDEIVANAQRILRGSVPTHNERFEIVYKDDPIKYLRSMVKDASAFTTHDYQIITPTRRGDYGSQRLNTSLQVIYNPDGPSLRLDRFDDKEALLTVRVNDKFLWIKNDYQLKLFNGEIGTITYVDPEDGELGITVEERQVTVPARIQSYSAYHGHDIFYDPRKQIELGYCVTTHKAQGSEFDTVVYCICRQHAWMLNKRNFYTAITRAKHKVIVVSDHRAMRYALQKYKAKRP